jgi:molecular chaperone DnaK (HSP70)
MDEEAHNVIFYNMGSTGLKVSLAQFQAVNNTKRKARTTVKKKLMEQVTVLAESWDESVNGNLFTIRLAETIADAFDEQPSRQGKSSIKDSPKSWLRLI